MDSKEQFLSFIHVIANPLDQIVPLPVQWFKELYDGSMPAHSVWIHTLHGYNAEVGMTLNNEMLSITYGWRRIMADLQIRVKNVLCFTAIDKGNYELLIYSSKMIPKNWFNITDNWTTVTNLQITLFETAPYRRFPSFMAFIEEDNQTQLVFQSKCIYAFKKRATPHDHVYIHYNNCFKKRVRITIVEGQLILTKGWQQITDALKIKCGYCLIFYALDYLNIQLIIYKEDGCLSSTTKNHSTAEMIQPLELQKEVDELNWDIVIPWGNVMRLPNKLMKLPGLRSGKRLTCYNLERVRYKWKLKEESGKKSPNLSVSNGMRIFKKENGLKPGTKCLFKYKHKERAFYLENVFK